MIICYSVLMGSEDVIPIQLAQQFHSEDSTSVRAKHCQIWVHDMESLLDSEEAGGPCGFENVQAFAKGVRNYLAISATTNFPRAGIALNWNSNMNESSETDPDCGKCMPVDPDDFCCSYSANGSSSSNGVQAGGAYTPLGIAHVQPPSFPPLNCMPEQCFEDIGEPLGARPESHTPDQEIPRWAHFDFEGGYDKGGAPMYLCIADRTHDGYTDEYEKYTRDHVVTLPLVIVSVLYLFKVGVFCGQVAGITIHMCASKVGFCWTPLKFLISLNKYLLTSLIPNGVTSALTETTAGSGWIATEVKLVGAPLSSVMASDSWLSFLPLFYLTPAVIILICGCSFKKKCHSDFASPGSPSCMNVCAGLCCLLTALAAIIMGVVFPWANNGYPTFFPTFYAMFDFSVDWGITFTIDTAQFLLGIASWCELFAVSIELYVGTLNWRSGDDVK